MLGLEDFWVILAYLLCIVSAVLCLIYGFLKWNSEGIEPNGESAHWAEEEIKIEKTL